MDNGAGPAGRLMAVARAARASGADRDEHAYWALVAEAVQGDSGQGVLRCGLSLLESADSLEREVGCDLVANAADRHESLRGGAATALMALAEAETRVGVLRSLVVGLGRTQDPRAVPALVRFSRHENADVRGRAAAAIGSANSGRPDGADVHALIRLTRDQDPDVRNWATFTLGCQLEHDTADIRAALWARATDEDGEVRQEAARGLARRHDPRALPLVARLLEAADGPQVFLVEAAEVLGAPELLPALHAYCEHDPDGTDRAIAACDPVQRARIEGEAWTVVVELERLCPGVGAALDSPRHESVHHLQVTVRGAAEAAADAVYDAASLLARADGNPTRAAELVLADLV
ncbi:HEAT repeat domain-containing protein [Kitasatospora sp. NPDC057692]|uniref:HEAT repeat domain-containing protein n=1 Tax=Kitasatospora sp. NPDC057692 TaxID=3346215 RepID=UPI00368A96BD